MSTGGHRPRIVAIVGPTGTGKSALALWLAGALGAEIVSADSRQVYRGLDVGTAKPSAEERARVPHHLIDVADPDEPFDVARYRRLATEAIAAIVARGRRVILCGGSGLYHRVLLYGLCAAPAGPPGLRQALLGASGGDARRLYAWLQRLDRAAAARLHPHDRVRIVRALEVVLGSGRRLSEWQRGHGFRERPFDALTIALDLPREVHARRIEERCRAMLAGGLVEEVESLRARYGPELPVLGTLGYREVGQMLAGKCSAEESLVAMAAATRQLAKRQRTWFRHQAEAEWFDADRDAAAVRARVEEFFAAAGPGAAEQSALACTHGGRK